MTTDTALPTAAPAQASEQPSAETLALTEKNRAIDQEDAANEPTAEQKAEADAAKAKPEKTPEQREIERLRRGLDRKHRQAAEARAELAHLRGLQNQSIEAHNRTSADDSEPLSLTRAQLREMVNAEAQKLAPTLQKQTSEAERRTEVVSRLAKTWGQERFNELSSDLDAAFDGLADPKGVPKPAVEAIFEADDAAMVIEYLANPDHDDEAEAISRMSAAQAGKAIAKLEARLSTEKAKAAPQVSKAPAPLEQVRGGGNSAKDPSTMTDAEFATWRRRQIAQRR